MNAIIRDIKQNLVDNFKILILSVVAYAVGVLLGLFLQGGETASDLAYDYVCKFVNSTMSVDNSPFCTFALRLLNSFLIIGFIFLLCSNKYTYFISFLIILYRGFIIGYAFIVFAINMGFNGVITFLFVVLTQNIIITFAIALLLVNSFKKLFCGCNNYFKVSFYYSAISYIVAVLAAILEFFMLICVFRPLNFYF